MKGINIRHSAGFGDVFTFSSIIKYKYAKEYDEVYFNIGRTNHLAEKIFKDTPNIHVGKFNMNWPTKALTWPDCVNDWDSWRIIEWDRDIEKEQECYDYFTKVYGKDYILVHWRGHNNGGQKMNPMNHDYFENKNLPYINIDAGWLKQQGHPIHDITDYRMLIENAKEIHAYEGNFSCMIAGLQTIKHIPFYLHVYCKNELFNENDGRGLCIKYINQGKWMKDNVNVKYLFEYGK